MTNVVQKNSELSFIIVGISLSKVDSFNNGWAKDTASVWGRISNCVSEENLG